MKETCSERSSDSSSAGGVNISGSGCPRSQPRTTKTVGVELLEALFENETPRCPASLSEELSIADGSAGGREPWMNLVPEPKGDVKPRSAFQSRFHAKVHRSLAPPLESLTLEFVLFAIRELASPFGTDRPSYGTT